MSEAAPGAEAVIELRLEDIGRLFSPFDPFPLPTRDLSESAEAFIVGWARELPEQQPIRINVHARLAGSNVEAGMLRQAISGYFAARAARALGDRHELLRNGRVSLLIGLTLLIVCIGVRQALKSLMPDSPVTEFAGEVLLLFGTVANWRPLEILLYEWWPIDRRRRLFDRLARAHIEVFEEQASPAAASIPGTGL